MVFQHQPVGDHSLMRGAVGHRIDYVAMPAEWADQMSRVEALGDVRREVDDRLDHSVNAVQIGSI